MTQTKKQKPWNRQKISGDHRIRFYRDAKSGHPFMSISRKNRAHYGHEMTTTPSLTINGKPRQNYVRFRSNPNRNDKRKSYYSRPIKRIKNLETNLGFRLRRYKNWRLSRKDLKRLKKIDKKKIKNVRPAND